MAEKFVLIDGHSILNRAFYGVPELTNSEGIHTNAVFGFLNIMFKILEEEQAGHLAVAFDRKEPTFRHKRYEQYKGTRKPMPEELAEQVPLMQEVLTAMGIPILTMAGYEADDILGTVAKRCAKDGFEVAVVSGDRDLLQLADSQIRIRIPKTSRGTTEVKDYYPEDVKREYQVTPTEFIDVKALMGDASDNIPGVPSIGEKTATNLIVTYGSIENAYAHVGEIKPPRAQKALAGHYGMAQLSKELATICLDCPIELRYEDAKIQDLYTEQAYQYLKRLEFKSLLTRFDAAKMGGSGTGGTRIEDEFWEITDIEQIDAVFAAAAAAGEAGIQIVAGVGGSVGTGGGTGAGGMAGAGGVVGIGGIAGVGGIAGIGGIAGVGGIAEVGGGAGASGIAGTGGIVGLGLCYEGADGQLGCYAIRAQGPVTADYLVGRIRELCSKATRVGVLDLKSQLPFLGLTDDSPLFDTGVAAYLLNPLKDTYGYDDLARDYLGMVFPSKQDLLGKQSLDQAFGEEEAGATTCICYMGYVALKAMGALAEKLNEAGMDGLFRDIEMPLIYSLHHMEQEGIAASAAALAAFSDKLTVRIGALEQEIYGLAGETFNINSPKQLGEVLFEHMKLPHGKKTKTGYSTAADVLDKLAPDYPVVSKILDYRQLTKLNSTYAVGLAAYIQADGRIHGSFNQTITATGRISSTEPNLQNIPIRMELGREIRKVFVPKEGCVFVDADYSQVELRILAHVSGDGRLISAYQEAQDIHAITASQVFHTPLDEVTSQLRRNAKAVNFGIVYGISAFGLSEGLSISRKEATEYIEKYFETYPGVKKFLDGAVAQGREQGYVTTLFGRRRPIPELKSANFMQRSFGERVAMNSPIQGTAADIMKVAMIAVDRELRARNLKSRIVLQVHDELLVETAMEEVGEVAAILEDKMKHAADLKVPLEVEVHTGNNWFETK